MGLIDLPSNNDYSKSLEVVIPSEDRNFERPRENFYMSTVDVNMAKDVGSGLIFQIQKFLKSKPYGISYNGQVDGKSSAEFLKAVSQLELALNQKYPNENFQLLDQGKINSLGFKHAIDTVKKLKSNPTKDNKDSNIIEFQKLLKVPETGQIDEATAKAAQELEQFISKQTNASASGLIFNSQTKQFQTTVSDVQEALKILQK
jgi:hypothetical protein